MPPQPPPPPPTSLFPQITRKTVYTRETAKDLLQIAERETTAPAIIYTARMIVRELAPRDYISEVNACLWFVRQHIRYQHDPDGIEVVFGPAEMIRLIQNYGRFSEDCESQSALLYSLLRAIGYPVRFACFNFSNTDKIDHMNVEARINDLWYMLDPILDPGLVAPMLDLVVWKEIYSLPQWR